MQIVKELIICRQIRSGTDVQICCVSAANFYIIQTLRLVLLVKQCISKRIKFSDAYLYTPDSSLREPEGQDVSEYGVCRTRCKS